MNIDEYNEEEYLDTIETNAGVFSEALPKVVREFQNSALEVSHGNGIPAAISFFTILGQICKDFITIPNGRNHEDTRIHFCWVQTSGTGKSTLWNFIGPISKGVFKKINDGNQHPPFLNPDNVPITRTFNTFGVTDYTDSVLIGGYVKETDDDGNVEWPRKPGLLEGSGLAHWDEFEYSGIFKQSQHKENSIVYLNTLMNSLAGESWVISKALTSFDNQIMDCFCERSILAMTYPPTNLNTVMAEKGVLQRMLLYVWDVPEYTQNKMRLEQIRKAGTIEEVNQPIAKYVDAMYKLYQLTQERFNSMGQDPLKTINYTSDFNQVLELEYRNMKAFLQNTRSDVSAIASNFTTRLMKILYKMSVLCSVASAPSIKDKSKRFIVTGHHVRQSATIVRQCYITLVDWLERSMRVTKESVTKTSLESNFIDEYTKMNKDDEGLVNKSIFLKTVRTKVKLSQAQIYRHYQVIRHKFAEERHGRSVFVKLIKGEDK